MQSGALFPYRCENCEVTRLGDAKWIHKFSRLVFYDYFSWLHNVCGINVYSSIAIVRLLLKEIFRFIIYCIGLSNVQ